MKKKPQRGGFRDDSGRKKLLPVNKKAQLCIYVEQWKIDVIGGAEEAKNQAKAHLDVLSAQPKQIALKHHKKHETK